MKTLTTKILLLAALVVGLPGVATAAVESDTDMQTMDLDIAEIAVIAVSAATVPTMTITAPAAGGNDPVDDSDNSTTVEYTSVVSTGKTRTISAQITTDDVPAGTQLTLTAVDVPAGCGSAAAEQILATGSAQTIITGIGSCATGDPGPTLTYSFEVTDVASLVADGDTAPVITLTITDDI